MNSVYGKTIERPVDKDYKFKKEGDELDKFWFRKYNSIIEDIQLHNSDIHTVRVQTDGIKLQTLMGPIQDDDKQIGCASER